MIDDDINKIIKIIVASVFILVAIAFQPYRIAVVDAGKTGIKVNLYGNNKGVDNIPLLTGICFYNLYTEQFHEFPIYMQNVVWDKEDVDESISFNSFEGAVFNADVAFSYTVKTEMVPHIFVKYRQELDVITKTNLRNKVREAFTVNSANYTASELFGAKKNEFLTAVKKQVSKELEEDGFIVDMVSIIGSLRAERKVMDSIDAVIQASQRAMEAENKVQQSEAEAKQKIAEADGEAQSILKVAESQAKANDLITKSITSELIKYKMIEKWDGISPKVIGSDSLIFNLGENGVK